MKTREGVEVEVSEMTVSFEILGDKDEWGGDGDCSALMSKEMSLSKVMSLSFGVGLME